MCLYVVWIEIYAKPQSWRPSWIYANQKSPQGFLSGNQAKFALHIHVTAKP